jgi:signal transduction histidine kinase
LRRLSPRRFGLRARITLAFAFGALLVSALLAVITFALTRANLIRQRESAVLTQVYNNARLVRDGLPRDPDTVLDLLSSLQTPTGSNPVLLYEGSWFPLSAQFGEAELPGELRSAVADGAPARMRYDLGERPALAVGIPIPAAGAAYFEIVELSDVEDTLQTLGLSLVGTSALTTILGASFGWWASRRALRPLADVSEAAEAIAGGRLDTRVPADSDPDLGTLAGSFNDMAAALQARIERDARFASDVSHELRSPLMTLSAAVEVLETRRDELPDRARAALDLLVAEVARFQQLVEDLLEISRFDAGAARLELDDVRLAEFVLQAVGASPTPDVAVVVDADLAGVVVRADKRRLARVLANLLDNAAKYGAGATAVTLRKVDDGVQLAVEDEGPGVAEDDQALIFDRFSRGGTAGSRGSGEGVGLGLALVSEHVRLHGGRVWVERRDDGETGARFVVEIPLGATS